MKKLSIVTVILLLTIANVFAYQNTYRLSSDEVQTFLMLRRVSSSITPDPTYPISGSQLSVLLKKINTAKLSENEKTIYDNLVAKLENPPVVFSYKETGADINTSVLGVQYVKSTNEDFFMPYKNRLPLADIKAVLYGSEYAAGLIDLDIRTTKDDCGDLSTLKDFTSFSYGFPSYAYGSAGYRNFNITVGRDRLGAGNGFSGNLELGENSLFEDFLKVSYVSGLFSYDFTVDTFSKDTNKSIHLEGPEKTLYLHRFSFAFRNTMNLTIYEGAMTYTANPFSDLKLLNPFMMIHNIGSYYDASTNNFFGAEILVNLPLCIQLNGQLLFDQICLPTESAPDESGETAFIAMLNLSKTMPLAGGFINVYAEGVYGNPYVYLKNYHGYGIDKNNHCFNYEPFLPYDYTRYDLVADIATDIKDGASKDSQYIGYKYGGDLFCLTVGADYTLKDLKLNASFLFLQKGIYGIRENEQRCAQDATEVYRKTFMTTLGCEYTLFKGLNLNTKVALYNKDIQFTVGADISILDFFKIRKTL